MIMGIIAGGNTMPPNPWQLSMIEPSPPVTARSLTTSTLGTNAPEQHVVGNGGGYTLKDTTVTNLTMSASNWAMILATGGVTFVFAPGASTTITESSDDSRVTWVSSNTIPAVVNAATVGASSFIVTVGNGVCYTGTGSSSGVTWTSRTIPAGDYRHVSYAFSGTPLYVATLASGTAYATSTDGITWVARTMATYSFRSFGWNGFLSAFVGVESSAVVISTDGINWTRHDLSSIGNDFSTLLWFPLISKYVVLPRTPHTSPVIATSTDAASWDSVGINVQGGITGNFDISKLSGPTYAKRNDEIWMFGSSVLRLTYTP